MLVWLGLVASTVNANASNKQTHTHLLLSKSLQTHTLMNLHNLTFLIMSGCCLKNVSRIVYVSNCKEVIGVSKNN